MKDMCFDMRKLLILLFLFIPLFANADNSDMYVINDLEIAQVDKDATTARQRAMLDGQREAFNIILERMGIDATNGILVSDDEILQMLRSMQIKDEKITNNSYEALLTMEFSQDYVSHFLNKYNITKYSPKLNSYLIVPILNERGNAYLLQKDNRWMAAFKGNLNNNKNILLIDNNYSTRNLVNKLSFKNPVYSNFQSLADLYNVNNVVIVDGTYDRRESLIKIKIRIMTSNGIKNATMDYEVENANDLTLDFNSAASKIIEYLEGLDKGSMNGNFIDISKLESGIIYLHVPISSIGDYNDIAAILNNNRNIFELKLKMLSKNMAIYLVKYRDNDLKLLIDSLKADGFSVNEKKDGLYIFYK